MASIPGIILALLPTIGLIYVGINRLIRDYTKLVLVLNEIKITSDTLAKQVEKLEVIDSALMTQSEINAVNISDIQEYLVMLSTELQGTVQIHVFRIRGSR